MKSITPSLRMQKHISAKYIYNENTGLIFRISANKSLIQVGSDHNLGYVRMNFQTGKETYPALAHRVAWFLYYGFWPDMMIDHIDGDKKNNKISNLRQVTCQQNLSNRKSNSNSMYSKFKGVTYIAKSDNWTARITNNNLDIFLGTYDTEYSAARAYNLGALALQGEYALFNNVPDPFDQPTRIFSTGSKRSEETRARMSIAQKKRFLKLKNKDI